MFDAIIGLEIHAQLLTRTKIFCGCPARFGGRPNTQTCPVCLGLPGALPVLNRQAVDMGVRAALALNCTIHERSIFARKNYFYPDLPKGYQITQYDEPLGTAGHLALKLGGGVRQVRVLRLHLEEDAGKSWHGGPAAAGHATLVDFNRSGVPLVEIVTGPDLRSGAEAAALFRELRAILVGLGINDGNMEEGSLRCDANVSVRPAGSGALGTKVEIKNLNSFRFLHRAIDHEVARQIDVVSRGGRVEAETRLWDAGADRSIAMRSKEGADDYRYFPEPDLPEVRLAPSRVAALRASLPELPPARRARFAAQYGLDEDVAALLAESAPVAEYFEEAAHECGLPAAAAEWVRGELLRRLAESGLELAEVKAGARMLGRLIRLEADGAISAQAAKRVFGEMVAAGEAPDAVIERLNLRQVSDPATLQALAREVIAAHPGPVCQYLAGRSATLGFLVGAAMKASGGRANPRLVEDMLKAELQGPADR